MVMMLRCLFPKVTTDIADTHGGAIIKIASHRFIQEATPKPNTWLTETFGDIVEEVLESIGEEHCCTYKDEKKEKSIC
jgi:hypothetical protein